jgi:hypothetical protein
MRERTSVSKKDAEIDQERFDEGFYDAPEIIRSFS